MHKLLSAMFHRTVIAGLFLLLQITMLVVFVLRFHEYYIPFYMVCVALSLVVSIWVVSSRREAAYKISWVVPILVFPLFGGLFYVMFVGNRLPKWVRKRMSSMDEEMHSILQDDCKANHLLEEHPDAAQQARYLERMAACPVYEHTKTQYFPLGELYIDRLVQELKQAKTYIFLEYFIIEEGKVWDRILAVLKEKVGQGVDVRIMYDDVGCMVTLPRKFDEKMWREYGIKTCVFNRFVPVLSLRLNDRNHRKMCIVDGKVAFTGGINLADEYTNEKEKYGHWKDSGMMLSGDGAWSMAVMFMTLWDYVNGSKTEIEGFRPVWTAGELPQDVGYVQPYTDNPLDNEPVGQTVYLNLIHKARKYMYITSPYLILDDTTATALRISAKSGVDVRIIVPHVPDKKMVFEVTRANYELLLEAGVRIFEYTPGFIHSKNFVVDDEFATIGSVNLDYRSLFLHFENGVWLYRTDTVLDMKDDFLATLERCQEVLKTDYDSCSKLKKLVRRVLKVFAPLL